MNLDDLSIDDLAALHGALGIIQGVAETLACLRPEAADQVRISLQPGELVTVTAPWLMPACGGCCADGVDFVIEDVPGNAPASGNPGGSGDLQQVHNAESPPPAPPGSAPETGESPEVVPVVTEPLAGAVPPASAKVPASTTMGGGRHGQH